MVIEVYLSTWSDQTGVSRPCQGVGAHSRTQVLENR